MWLFFLFCFLLEREAPFLLRSFPCLFIFMWDMRKWDEERDLCSGLGARTVFAIKCQEFRLNLQAWNISTWNVWKHFSTCLRAPLDPACSVLCTLHAFRQARSSNSLNEQGPCAMPLMIVMVWQKRSLWEKVVMGKTL